MFYVYCFTNTINSKMYIGSTDNWKRRRRQHFRFLELGTHHSPIFQNDYNFYGKNVYTFRVVAQFETEEKALDNEQVNVTHLFEIGLNLNAAKDVRIPNKFADWNVEAQERQREYARERISELNKDPDFQAKCKRGKRALHDGEYGKRFSQNNIDRCARTYKLQHTNGAVITVYNLKEFCRIHNLNDSAIRHTFKTGNFHRSGYRIIESIEPTPRSSH